MLCGSGDIGLIYELIRGAYIPLVHYGDDATFINTDFLPGRLGHVEVRPWHVAPAAIIIGEGVIRWAKVSGRHGHCHARLTKQRVRALAITCDLVTLPARGAVVE